MDPIAHTFVGATLAQTGLRSRSAAASAALIVGANLPDIDGIATLLGSDGALYWRRGWTHGLPALVVLPIVLTLALWWWERSRGRGSDVRPKALLALSYLAVLSHPILDWMNNYGMRWLMPIDGTWFYGDTLFIVDPWIWTMLGGAVFLAHSRTSRSLAAWGVYAAVIAALFFTVVPGLAAAKFGWVLAVGALAWLRYRGVGGGEGSSRRLARVAVAAAIIYIAAMHVSARYAAETIEQALLARGIEVERLMVGPVPANPFERDVVAETPQGYRYGTARLWPTLRLQLAERVVPRLAETPAVRAAWTSPAVRGFTDWARFPFAEVERRPGGYTVYLMDARYTRSRAVGFGSARVDVDDAELIEERAPTDAP